MHEIYGVPRHHFSDNLIIIDYQCLNQPKAAIEALEELKSDFVTYRSNTDKRLQVLHAQNKLFLGEVQVLNQHVKFMEQMLNVEDEGEAGIAMERNAAGEVIGEKGEEGEDGAEQEASVVASKKAVLMKGIHISLVQYNRVPEGTYEDEQDIIKDMFALLMGVYKIDTVVESIRATGVAQIPHAKDALASVLDPHLKGKIRDKFKYMACQIMVQEKNVKEYTFIALVEDDDKHEKEELRAEVQVKKLQAVMNSRVLSHASCNEEITGAHSQAFCVTLAYTEMHPDPSEDAGSLPSMLCPMMMVILMGTQCSSTIFFRAAADISGFDVKAHFSCFRSLCSLNSKNVLEYRFCASRTLHGVVVKSRGHTFASSYLYDELAKESAFLAQQAQEHGLTAQDLAPSVQKCWLQDGQTAAVNAPVNVQYYAEVDEGLSECTRCASRALDVRYTAISMYNSLSSECEGAPSFAIMEIMHKLIRSQSAGFSIIGWQL
ncbi:uncharacterized protein LAESUDRAFT_714063 [Laetiporus sulphureus 93-53]|uniref:Uncharacterized protein n=1 Tax=Laetiporus sulphureus 93-53 TaxID=1314785 RepID=A0A165EAH8_9APHY|nr:uncharacterized protein LAESUDRAFT_714063 [Laetiporus sulphureus 93-53]KZT06594.1 hypothetical protein LAESUDRAFT_714063 [Laetiporus sulphureus 93-53]